MNQEFLDNLISDDEGADVDELSQAKKNLEKGNNATGEHWDDAASPFDKNNKSIKFNTSFSKKLECAANEWEFLSHVISSRLGTKREFAQDDKENLGIVGVGIQSPHM